MSFFIVLGTYILLFFLSWFCFFIRNSFGNKKNCCWIIQRDGDLAIMFFYFKNDNEKTAFITNFSF